MSLNGVEILNSRAFDRALEAFDVNARLGNHEVVEEFRALVEGLVERMLADRLAETAALTPDVVPDSGPSGHAARASESDQDRTFTRGSRLFSERPPRLPA
jgi:Ni,Fe-hydrogenase III large subunit